MQLNSLSFTPVKDPYYKISIVDGTSSEVPFFLGVPDEAGAPLSRSLGTWVIFFLIILVRI